MNFLFSILLIGETIRDLPLWRHPSIHMIYLDDCSDLSPLSGGGGEIDFILLSTPVEWKPDGSYSIVQLRADIEKIKQFDLAVNKIILTSIIPIEESQRMGCHYAPLSILSVMNEKRTIGLNLCLPTDEDLLRGFFTLLLHNPVFFRIPQDVEILYLIEICQLWINQSFQREIALFCKKSQVASPFLHASFPKKEMYPMLVYMIRKIEDTKIDCPLLYSCLFRHNYIDINI